MLDNLMKQEDGYDQRNMRQFLHILVSPGYAPGTIAVNVTWIERGFNAGQMYASCAHLSSTVYELARYWSEIATFPTSLHLTPPLGVLPSEFRGKI